MFANIDIEEKPYLDYIKNKMELKNENILEILVIGDSNVGKTQFL